MQNFSLFTYKKSGPSIFRSPSNHIQGSLHAKVVKATIVNWKMPFLFSCHYPINPNTHCGKKSWGYRHPPSQHLVRKRVLKFLRLCVCGCNNPSCGIDRASEHTGTVYAKLAWINPIRIGRLLSSIVLFRNRPWVHTGLGLAGEVKTRDVDHQFKFSPCKDFISLSITSLSETHSMVSFSVFQS